MDSNLIEKKYKGAIDFFCNDFSLFFSTRFSRCGGRTKLYYEFLTTFCCPNSFTSSSFGYRKKTKKKVSITKRFLL